MLGLYAADDKDAIAGGYASALHALPSGWYRLVVDYNSSTDKTWASDDYIYVENDGNFVDDGDLYNERPLRGASTASMYQAGLTDADYDGVVLSFEADAVPAEYAENPQAERYDGTVDVLVAGTAEQAGAIGQADRVRINVGLGKLSDIIGKESPAKAVQLDQVVLYRSDYATLAALEARAKELADDDIGNNDLDYMPTRTNFADESKRAVAWSRADGAGSLSWHVKDESGARVRQGYNEYTEETYYYSYDEDEYYALVLDGIGFDRAPIESGVYFPLAVIEMNGEKFTYVCAPLEITASAQKARRDPTIATETVPDAVVGMPYSATLSARSGLGTTATAQATLTWSIASGALPAGLALDVATGAISGKPTKAGDYAFTVALTEKANGDDKGRTVTQDFSIKVSTQIVAGDIVYDKGTYWMDQRNDFHVSMPLNIDLLAAGLSGTEAYIVFSWVKPDGTIYEHEAHGEKIAILPGYAIDAHRTLGATNSWWNENIYERDDSTALKSIQVTLYPADADGNYVLVDAAGNCKFYGQDYWYDESGKYGQYCLVLKNAAGVLVANVYSGNSDGSYTYKYYDTGAPYTPSAGEFDWEPLKIVKTANVEGVEFGSYVNFPKLTYEGDEYTWPCTEAQATVWKVGAKGAAAAAQTVDLTRGETVSKDMTRALRLEPGTYRFTIQGRIYDDANNSAWVDIAENVTGAKRVAGVSPATYEFTVGPNELADIGATFGGANLVDYYSATVTFEDGAAGGYETAWYRKDGGTYYLIGTGTQMRMLAAQEGAPAPEVYVKVTPYDSTAYYPTDYVKVEGHFASVVIEKRPTFTVSGTLACESGWTPADNWINDWGTLRVMKPAADGEYKQAELLWPQAAEFTLADITPGTRIIFTPRTESVCRSVTYEVPAAQTAAISGITLTAPYMKGIVRLASFDFVAADREFDPATGADYAKDDAEETRTTPFALNGNGTRVKATDVAGNAVPVYVFDSMGLVIQDDEAKLVPGAKYTLEISVCDPTFSTNNFKTGDYFAVHQKVEVTLGTVDDDLAEGRIGATDVKVKAASRGRAVVHYANPGGNSVRLFLYNAGGKLVGEESWWGNYEGTISLPFMDAGAYTLCAVESSEYGAKAKTDSSKEAKAPSTLAELKAFGFAADEYAELPFTVTANKLTDVGVQSPFTFPASKESDVVDRANSSVTATSSFSDYTTITITVALLEGANTAVVGNPTLRIHTNQKQIVEKGGNTQWQWPRSLTINGKSVVLNRWVNGGNMEMTDGWVDLDLYQMCPGYAGAESFPMTISLTVPRTDFDRTQASAYLQLRNGRSNFIGSFDQIAEELSLVVPEVTAERTFTAHGFTASGADVALLIDGVEATTTKADEYGYYTTELTLPESAEDLNIFDVQATATWSREGKMRSAASEVLDVTYSTTRPSLKRLWMLTQSGGARGEWTSMLIYDNGEWTSMYKSYYLGGSWENRRYIWLAELNNAEYATNVTTVVPKSDGDLLAPMTQEFDEADLWLGLDAPGTDWYVMPDLRMKAEAMNAYEDPIMLGVWGSYDYRGAADMIKSLLETGNVFVSEPISLTNAPSGVYVTFDEIERQILEQTDPFTGFAGLDAQDVGDYIYALNESSKNLLIVEKDLDKDGNLVKASPAAIAKNLIAQTEGQTVTDYLAVSFALDPVTFEVRDDPYWLQLHHTVQTSAVDMSEPLTLISNAQSKYAEYLSNIAAAVKAGGEASDAHTYCPCKEAGNATGGIPIVEMFARADGDLDPMRFFIWSEDSAGNAYIRSMEKYEIAGTNAVAYRQYEADERRIVITEWNGQTGQKTVMTYEIPDAIVANNQGGAQAPADFEFVVSLWMYVGMQVQLGINEAEDALIAGIQTRSESDPVKIYENDVSVNNHFRLKTQDNGHVYLPYGDNKVENVVIGAGNGIMWTFNSIEDGYKAADRWVSSHTDWRMRLLKDEGIITDWGELSDKELQSLFKFIADNRSGCFDFECKIEASSRNNWISPFGQASAAAYRGGLHKVYEALNNATNKGKSFYDNGVANTVASDLKSKGKTKAKQALDKAAYGAKHGYNNSSAYSQEYYRIVKAIFDFQQTMQNKDPNCIKWDAIPDDLYYNMVYAQQERNKRAERARANGSVFPKGKSDPSGFVYEGMFGNRIEGATVTLYTYNPQGDPSADYATFVDSEKFGYEENPQVTGEDGRYQWFVGSGYWQVRVEKEGYAPVSTGSSGAFGIGATKEFTFDKDGNPTIIPEEIDATKTIKASSYWMPVLPEQLDVNIPLVSSAAPTIKSLTATAERTGVDVVFSKPLKVSTVSASQFKVDGKPVAGLEPIGAEEAADGSGDVLATTFRVAFASGVSVPDEGRTLALVMAANATAESYKGTRVDPASLGTEIEFAVPGLSTPEPPTPPTPEKKASSISLAAQTVTYTGSVLGYTGTVNRSGSTGAVTYEYFADAACTKAATPQNAGAYYVRARLAADGNYLAAVSEPVAFTIAPKKVTPTVKLSKTSLTYNGKAQKPKVTVKVGNTALSTSGYTLTWAKGRKAVGTYKVKVTLKGNYTGTKTASFKIVPKGTTISKATAASKGFTLKWKKQATQTAGYQIQYALNSKFTKGKKSVTVKGAKTTSKKISKLKAKKKYYVRIRTYKKVGKTTYYSAWSKTKTVTTKS